MNSIIIDILLCKLTNFYKFNDWNGQNNGPSEYWTQAHDLDTRLVRYSDHICSTFFTRCNFFSVFFFPWRDDATQAATSNHDLKKKSDKQLNLLLKDKFN